MGRWASRRIERVLARLMTRNQAEILMSVLGLVAAVTPLLLWASWSSTMLGVVFGAGVGSAFGAIALAQYANPDSVEGDDYEDWCRRRDSWQQDLLAKDKLTWRDQA